MRFTDTDLRQFAGDLPIGNHFPYAPDFQVTFGRVHNHVEVIVGAVFFLDEGTEHIFQYAHHGGAIYVLAGFKVGEDIY